MARHWTLDDIPWQSFDPKRVEPELLRAVKAASLVEGNAADYVTYLTNIAGEDEALKAAVAAWGEEEAQHGAALSRWAELADPAFDYARAIENFRAGYRLPLDATRSVRGSLAGELIARCVVECGTSSFYSAIRDAAAEPVLKLVAARIAGDEFRHYKLFFDHFRRYQARDRLSRLARLRVAYGRFAEASDDELAFAYYCANEPPEPYRRRRYSAAYSARALPLYRFGHVQRALGMALKPCEIDPQGRLASLLSRAAWWGMQTRAKRLGRRLEAGAIA